jgi:hypothetical protein
MPEGVETRIRTAAADAVAPLPLQTCTAVPGRRSACRGAAVRRRVADARPAPDWVPTDRETRNVAFASPGLGAEAWNTP